MQGCGAKRPAKGRAREEDRRRAQKREGEEHRRRVLWKLCSLRVSAARWTSITFWQLGRCDCPGPRAWPGGRGVTAWRLSLLR